jgi:hypothetical protein
MKQIVSAFLLCACLSLAARAQGPTPQSGQHVNGMPRDPGFFPIAVWLQDPRNAQRYKDIGINVYVALWRGPTEAQLQSLEKAGMLLVCSQNQVGLKHKDSRTIVGWMHGDEPDNAQALPKGQKGYGPPILPEKIVEDYRRIRESDSTRPVLLNLGQGVAWDGWHGRGVRTNKPEDYPQYAKGGDIVSFDIYPVAHDNKQVAGNLWYVARGVDRLRNWTEGQKSVWCCIECTHISNEKSKATPQQVRSEVWMALIHGANGLIYFCHEFKPKFIEAGLLADPEMAKGVAAINAQIKELAPVLNSPAVADGAKAASSNAETPVAVMTKRHDGSTYVFAVAMRDSSTQAKFTLLGLKPGTKIEVLGENRSIPAGEGSFADQFGGYAVHLYRIAAQ